MIHPVVSFSLISKTNARVASVILSSAFLACASKDLQDSKACVTTAFVQRGRQNQQKLKAPLCSHFKH